MTAWIDRPSHRAWLEGESQRLLAFGAGFVTERGAGWLDDDGRIDSSQPVFTWITARMAHVYGLASLRGVPGAAPLASAALGALLGPLRDEQFGGWFAALDAEAPASPEQAGADLTKSAYTHAFVVLAASTCTVAGLPGAAGLLEEALVVLDERFWDDAAGLHRDTWDRSWQQLDDYRGVNANMHSVEALLAAADATGDPRWRRRAQRITAAVLDWAGANDWRIPEHFDADWSPQLELNADRRNDPFKPYGATVGHGLEWSRLALHVQAALGADAPESLLTGAQSLYRRAVADGWAADGGPGFVYTTDWSGTPVVRERMHWVVAEAIGAAAALYRATGADAYVQDYQRWWDYAAEHVIDPADGSWRHELDAGNAPSASVWPGKPDIYHAYQATLIPRSPLAPGLAAAQAAGAV